MQTTTPEPHAQRSLQVHLHYNENMLLHVICGALQRLKLYSLFKLFTAWKDVHCLVIGTVEMR
jgi:hypothetical protein